MRAVKNANGVSSHPSAHAIIQFSASCYFFRGRGSQDASHGRLGGAFVRTKNGLGISSHSGSQIGGSPFSAAAFSFSAILAAKALPLGSGLRVPSSRARPPALACANSTSVRPLVAMIGLVAVLIMLFLMAILFRSSVFEALDLRVGLRVGDNGTFSWETRFADDGIFERRRFGEELRSLRAVVLGWARRSGAVESVGNVGAVAALPARKLG
jgi:hypothetical protein